MTAIEFFEKEHQKAKNNYLRAVSRNADNVEKVNLLNKVRYYAEAIMALKDKKEA